MSKLFFILLACSAVAVAGCTVAADVTEDDPVTGDGGEAVDAGVPPQEAWSPLTEITVVDPLDFGATGDGRADDTDAIRAAIGAVADDGGVVWLEPGTRFRTSDVIRIYGDHIKLWTPNGGAELFTETGGRSRAQAIIVDGGRGVGLFGLRIASDVDRRRTALEDSAVVVDGGSDTEVVGLEISNASSAAVMVFGGSRRTLVDGNYIHDTWADGIHFTDGADGAWVWNNTFTTSPPADGDDGIACVTYGSGPRCRNMEWWNNLHLGGPWGRGLAVVGGEDIVIHHNTVCRTAAAGILVASEPSYDTPGSDRIEIFDNVIVGAGHVVPHPGILISGMSGPLADIVVRDNVVAESVVGQPLRVEGDVNGVDHSGTTVEATDGVVCPPPGEADPRPKDTSILATRDSSFVAEEYRRGLYRILVRPAADGRRFEQQFEYVATDRGSAVGELGRRGDVATMLFTAGDRGEENEPSQDFIVIRSARPLTLPEGFDAVTFEDLRALAGDRPVLWSYLDAQ